MNKGNVSSATQAVTSSKNALDGVEPLAQDKQTAGNSLNHLDQLTPAQQQALENQINNATTRDKVAEIIAQAQALNEAMKALKKVLRINHKLKQVVNLLTRIKRKKMLIRKQYNTRKI
ncbi:hypothetical protein ACVNP0_13360 [Staphylococcus aureus]